MSKRLNDFDIHAIPTLVRDLSLIAADVQGLENALRTGKLPIERKLLAPLPIRQETGETLRVGDLVLFSPKTMGTFAAIDVADEKAVPLTKGHVYVGVLCEIRSGKHFCAQFVEPPKLTSDLDLQYVTPAGGLGFATGYSKSMEINDGCGRAGDVEIIGAIIDPRSDRPVNTLDLLLRPELAKDYVQHVPLVLVCGSGADAGKTTTAAALVEALSVNNICSAVKATGTGRQSDSLKHLKGGATYIMGQMDVGLPTTYIDKTLFLQGMGQLFFHASHPDSLSDALRLDHHRGRRLQAPDVVMAELGGDLGEAGIPALLEDAALMHSLAGIIICAEGLLALAGSLAELEKSGITAKTVPIYAAVPWGNVEGIFRRFSAFVESGQLTGIFDILKPKLQSEREWRLAYSQHHGSILSVEDVASRIVGQNIQKVAVR